MEPFLRWAGGKIWLKKVIDKYLPPNFLNYHEPFLGGGSIFFHIDHIGLINLSDINSELINTYIEVRDHVEEVIIYLTAFQNTKTEYYRIRETIFPDQAQRAAKFIYLNMTSFNGIYRVNRMGKYNVPYGFRKTIDFIQEDTLRLASQKLQGANINQLEFTRAFDNVQENDLVFLDPPYTVAHSNNGFIRYNQKLFSLDDQYALADKLRELNRIGAKFILTNAYHKKIKEIFHDTGNFHKLKRKSLIGGKGAKRECINEYLIRNF